MRSGISQNSCNQAKVKANTNFPQQSPYSVWSPLLCISLFRIYSLFVSALSPYVSLFPPPYSPFIIHVHPLYVFTLCVSPFRIYILCVYPLSLFCVTSVPCIFLTVYLLPYVFSFCTRTHSLYVHFLNVSSFLSLCSPCFIYSPWCVCLPPICPYSVCVPFPCSFRHFIFRLMIMIFSLSTSAYLMGMLYGYKTNHLLPSLAEVFRMSIIIQINVGSLEKVTSGSYAPVLSHFPAL